MNYKKITIAVAACCILGVIIYSLSGKNGDAPAPQQEASQEAAPQESVTKPPPGNEQQPASGINAEVEDESTDTLKKLHEILLSANEYYNDVKEGTVVLTQNGFLYNAAADIVVTPEYLVKRDYLSPDYTLNGAAVLFLKPEDLAEAMSMEDYSNELKVFVSAPVEGGYIVDTTRWDPSKISNDEYGGILDAYKINHGALRRITSSTEEYPEINALLREYEQLDSDLFIRYGMRDDKYAVIIASPKNNYAAIYQYVLAFEDGKWSVRIPNLESVTKTRTVANAVCPDMDALLMPDYDVKSFNGYMMQDFSGVTPKLIDDGYLTEENAVLKYISATNKFMFAKYENGQMFVGVYTGDVWVLGEVDSPESAQARIRGVDEHGADFVIIWE